MKLVAFRKYALASELSTLLRERKFTMRFRRGAAAFWALVATGTATLASAYQVPGAPALPYWTTIVATSDWLNIAVADASTQPGAPIIQWWATGGAEQQWHVPADDTDGPIINKNSGMCITTDLYAGHTLFQAPCNNPVTQLWHASGTLGIVSYTNPASGLVLDVYGYNMWAGGVIDGWYSNNAPNQHFWSSTSLGTM
jgi:Ricin-type beta-trefoil lectin domain-like